MDAVLLTPVAVTHSTGEVGKGQHGNGVPDTVDIYYI